MKTLYIHIGTPKTATTSLQHFCAENAPVFEEQGYCYPIYPHKFRHVSTLRNAFFLSYKLYDGDPAKKAMEEESFFRHGMDFDLQSFRKFDNVILSDEAIWNVVFKRGKPDLWEKLRREADRNGYVIKVIVYLRRQDGLAESWWNQKVKNGQREYSTVSWEEFMQDPSFFELNYYEALEKIAQSVGKENMIVRRFGRQYFKNGSIFEDFVDALGMRYSHRFVISDEKRNIRLFGNTHEIKRILNCIPGVSEKENRYLKNIVTVMSEQRSHQNKETMFSPEEAEQFMEQYRDGNRKIMQEYFGKDEDLFDMDYSGNRKWVLSHSEMEKDIVTLVGHIALNLKRENIKLRQELSAMNSELSAQKKILEDVRKKSAHPLKKIVSAVKK